MTETDPTLSLAEQAQIANLMTAQIDVLLMDLHRRRAELAAQIASLHGQDSSGLTRIDKLRTDLNAEINSSLAAIDALIEETETAAQGLRREAASA
ncbi:hypothetical protein MKK88_15420 [Methylobacterium sp. E-005]|uniref:hypothetical protein n=1 Tax=Methylobacterium sp. E-005 TaxID=2836549 RepID=UPI001FB8FA6F|nr:hypothetical protein [Methylobacterium sp. E-005]MCJ2087364.1 hypothetical protein [Methylobacterium sp. E-005]